VSVNRTGTKHTPSRLFLPEGIEKASSFPALQKALEYEDKRVTYEYLRWKKVQKQDDRWLASDGSGYRNWFVLKYGRSALDQKVRDLGLERYKSCLLSVGNRYYVYSGLRRVVEDAIGKRIDYPTFIGPHSWKNIPWVKEPPASRWYQQKALDAMCPLDGSRSHAAVEMGTGTGKSLLIAMIAKRIGLPAVVVVPTLSIANQMVESLSRWFGAGKVGQFFGGKKKPNKHIVVAVSASLARVESDTVEWKALAEKKVVLVDECHLTPPESLSTVMFNLFQDVPYRYFFSGTCFRNDGLQLLLQGITGDVVFSLSVRQGIEEGFLSPLKFFQWRVGSDCKIRSDDPLKMTKIHLHKNKKVYAHAAALINRAVVEKRRRVLVLVDTVDQFQYLLDAGLVVPARFAHGGVTAANRNTVPTEHWKSNPKELVKSFDAGEYPVLVGTSCIGIGTDIKSADFIVSIVGLTSEIEISQGIGRGTRLFPGKTSCIYNDYWVTGIDCLERHAEKRREIFNSIYGTCKVLNA
jgi:superfamily II DNA or RNA helicase